MLFIAGKKYFSMLPDQVRHIVECMLNPISSAGTLNFEQFQKWLDINPSIRLIIKECVKPQLWTLNEKGYTHYYSPDNGSNMNSTTINGFGENANPSN